MVPSLPLWLKLPDMPNDPLRCAPAAKVACRPESGTASTSPSPNVGEGIRKMTLFAVTAAAKFGCAMLQPGASARPVMTKRSCTPPSGVPFGLFTNRASRTGPFALMKDGTVFFAPFAVATATCGFTGGLEPRVAGSAWHPPQRSKLNRGPNPRGTVSTSLNRSVAAVKKATSFAPRPGSGPPAPGAPPRGPGSTAVAVLGCGCGCGCRNCAKAGPDDKAVAPNIVMAMPGMDHLHAWFVIIYLPIFEVHSSNEDKRKIKPSGLLLDHK